MKLSLNWLNDFIDLADVPLERIVRELTLRTCEVEEFYPAYAHLDDVVVARVLEKERHPNADRLSLCKVDAGTATLPIVCGAPNVAAGMFVPLARIGAKLPMGGEILEIKSGKIRGEISEGMLCSAKELGLVELTEATDGLIDLGPHLAHVQTAPPWAHPASGGGAKKTASQKIAKKAARSKVAKKAQAAPPGGPPAAPAPAVRPPESTIGTPLSVLFALKDSIIDIDNKSITHRPDLWSHYGFARELSAIFNRPLKFNPLATPEIAAAPGLPSKKIVIEPGAAYAYFGQHVRGVRVGPSPAWLRARLWNVGQRPINNVVDATNYLMFEIGQPNHAFDARELKSDTIGVATAEQQNIKTFTTLDGVAREIPPHAIMILDGADPRATPLALGGIMGGLASGVREDTNELFLESATFPREKIRFALAKLQLRTESAIRFEKGQDPAQAQIALHRLVDLLALTCPDLAVGKIAGKAPVGAKRNVIKIPAGFIPRRLGVEIADGEVRSILERLGCTVQSDKKGGQAITVPTYRSWHDLTIPEDIVEEVGRIYGLDRIEPVAPLIACAPPVPNERRAFERALKTYLAQTGNFFETYNYSFAAASDNELFGQAGLALANPTQADRDRMRVSLIPGLLRQAAGNQDRFDQVRLFEFGRSYFPGKKGELPTERFRVALVALPDRALLDGRDGLLETFLAFRGFLEDLLRSFTRTEPNVRVNAGPGFYHPNCAVELACGPGEAAAVLIRAGILSPAREKDFDLKRPALLAEIDFDAFFEARAGAKRAYSPPSVFPDSNFEFSIVMDRTASTREPVRVIEAAGVPELRAVRLLTIYQGPPLPDDRMSVSYGVRCGLQEGTLTGERLQAILDLLVGQLNAAGFPLR